MNLLIHFILPFCLFTKSPGFEMVSATSQKWSGGVQSAGSGVNYKIMIVARHSDKQLSFSKLRVEGEELPIKLIKYGNFTGEKTFEKGDTLLLTAQKQILPSYKQKDKKELIVDDEFAGDALIFYKRKGKNKTFTIDKFTKLKPLRYP